MPQRLASRAICTKALTAPAGALRRLALIASRAMARAAAARSVSPHHPTGAVARAALAWARPSSLNNVAGRAGGGLFFVMVCVEAHAKNFAVRCLSTPHNKIERH